MIISNDKVVKLKRKDLNKILNIIVEAFMTYPVPGSFIKDEDRRRIALREMFKIEIKKALKKDNVISLGGDYQEVSVWKASTAVPSNLAYLPFLSLSSLRLMSSISGREMKLLNLYFEEVIKAKKSLVLPDNTAELFILAVNPNNQGEGRASKMLRPVLEELDSQGLSCLVITNTEANCKIYNSYGFHLIQQLYDNRSSINTFFLLRK